MHGWVILPIPCLWGRIPLTVLKDRQICVHPPSHAPIISQFTHHFSYIPSLTKGQQISLCSCITFQQSLLMNTLCVWENKMRWWYVPKHSFMGRYTDLWGLIIWTHSHHTSDSYLQLQFLLVPSHYCFGTQNIVIRKRNDYLAGYQAAESFKGHHLTGNRPGTTVYFITEASLFCNSFPVDKVW